MLRLRFCFYVYIVVIGVEHLGQAVLLVISEGGIPLREQLMSSQWSSMLQPLPHGGCGLFFTGVKQFRL